MTILYGFTGAWITFIFPQQPGNVVRDIPTGHSTSPLKEELLSGDHYVWPYAKGSVRGHGILPLHYSVPQAIELDQQLYEIVDPVFLHPNH